MNAKITILTPSCRPNGLARLIRSIKATASHPENIQLLVGVDKGNDKVFEFAGEYERCWVAQLPAMEKFSPVAAVNFLAERTDADYLWVVNDDCILVTPGWDEKIMSQPQGSLGVPSSDPCEGSWDFPVVTRRHLLEFATVYPDVFRWWQADSWLFMAYADAKRLHVHQIDIIHQCELYDRAKVEAENAAEYQRLQANGDSLKMTFSDWTNRIKQFGEPLPNRRYDRMVQASVGIKVKPGDLLTTLTSFENQMERRGCVELTDEQWALARIQLDGPMLHKDAKCRQWLEVQYAGDFQFVFVGWVQL